MAWERETTQWHFQRVRSEEYRSADLQQICFNEQLVFTKHRQKTLI